ncbi:MAG: alpha/beta fold hydrolase [Pseudomonadota bacterium]
MTRLTWLCALAWVALIAPVRAAAPDAAVFFQRDAMSGAALSPNGRYAAIRVATRDTRAILAVLDLATMKPTTVASFKGDDVGRFEWVSDERLVYSLFDGQAAQGDMVRGPGLFAVDRDGKNDRILVQRYVSRFNTPIAPGEPLWGNAHLIGSGGVRDNDAVYLARYDADAGKEGDYLQVLHLNTRSGRTTDVDTPPHARSVLIDARGEVRVAITADQDHQAVMYNDPASHAWHSLKQFARFGMGERIEPLFAAEDGALYVRAANGDKQAIYRYDLKANGLPAKPLLASDAYDIDGHFITDGRRALGYRYHIDAEVTAWFDPALQAIQGRIDALLPATTNRLSRGQRSETPFVLVDSFSDAQPHVFLLFNNETGKLVKLGAANPDIDPKQMAMKDMVRYKARDGLEIPAYLTLPNSAKRKLPMVVLVHGGPFVRGGYWAFSPEAQFLAARGYAVLEPEFRGSTGFGTRHFQAGWKQWGRAMQDDVADGARWAIAQGIADPKRICIAGASYGGYATLMGLVNDPDLFKCGFEWVGVTDLDFMYTVDWSDFPDAYKKFGMPLLVGDRVADAAQFKATSPLAQAARIKQPLLLAYGGADVRVPIIHGTRFYDAVKATNPNVEWIEYEKEGHGWYLPATNVDFWTRVEKFLDRQIGH